ncbi:hypothetical protein KQH26_00490 [bacterium]|nr:hypothetical protein [bacterium]
MENSDQLLEKMKLRNIKPKPSWHFTAKAIFFWVVFLISVLLGAFAFSVVLFSIQQIEFDLLTHMSHSYIELLIGLAPLFWIISLIIFLIIAMIGIKNSKKGYKFSFSKIIAFSASFSILIGTLFFIGGGAQWLEHAFSVRIGIYESVQEKKVKMWTKPEEGRLAGTILKFNEESIELNDFNNQTWLIDIEQANVSQAVFLEEKEIIKIIGEIISNHNFRADVIKPWGGQPGQRRKKLKNK